MVIGLSGVQFGLYGIVQVISILNDIVQVIEEICLSRVWLQTEFADTKSYYHSIIKITISEKRIAKL